MTMSISISMTPTVTDIVVKLCIHLLSGI